MAAPSDNYSVVWVRYNRKEEGCITHAYDDSQDRTVCGLAAPESGFEGGFETLTEADGHIGCRRCIKALTKRGVLPFSTTLRQNARGEWIKVAIQ